MKRRSLLAAVALAALLLLVWALSTDRSATPVAVSRAPADSAGAAGHRPLADGADPSRASDSQDQRELAVAEGTELRLAWPDGRPIASAAVAIARLGEVAAQATTDAQGRARLPVVRGRFDALVASESMLPWAGEIEIDAAAETIVVPRPGRIAGELRNHGARPRRRLAFEVRTYVADPIEPSDALAASVPSAWLATDLRRLETDRSGRFELDGLAHDWQGELAFGGDADVVSVKAPLRALGGNRATLLAPSLGLELDVRPHPTIEGRVVWEHDRSAVGLARIAVDAGEDTARETIADELGRFAVTLPWGAEPLARREPDSQPNDALRWLVQPAAERRVTLRIGAPDRSFEHELELTPEPTDPWNVGDVALPRAHAIDFVVRGPSGAPIDSVFARSSIATVAVERGGRGAIAIAPEETSLRFAAHGWRERSVAIDSATPSPLEIELVACNALELALVDADGAPASGATVRLNTEGDVLVIARVPELGRALAPVAPSELVSEYGAWRATADADGLVTMSDLVAGEPIAIELLDDAGRTAARVDLVLAADERRRETLAFPRDLFRLTGAVRNAAGAALAGAKVEIFGNDFQAESTRLTDARGRFEFARVIPGHQKITASLGGHASRTRYDDFGRDRREIDFVLHRERSLDVALMDDAGYPVMADTLELRCLDGVTRRGAGSRYHFDSVPTVPIDAVVEIFGERFVLPIAADATDVALRLPAFGRAEFALAAPADAAFGEALELRVHPRGDAMRVRSAYYATASPSALALEGLAPGDYRAELWRSSLLGDRQADAVRLSGPVDFSVRAKETTRVELDP